MCTVFKVGKSSFYEWLKRKPSLRNHKDTEHQEQVEQAYFKAKQRYGSPRITAELNAQNIKISRPKVAKLMKKLGLCSKIGKKFISTTDSKHSYPVVENLLNRNFSPDKPAEVWVSDITYIPTLDGFIYLTTTIDLFDRKVIGWAISEGMSTQDTSLAAWDMAVKNRSITPDMIFILIEEYNMRLMLLLTQCRPIGSEEV